MTDGLNVVSTDIWRVLLPADWKQEAQEQKSAICFKSDDESKCAYFLAWTIEEGTAQMTPQERCRADFEGLRAMQNGEWKIVDEWENRTPQEFSKCIDCFNDKAYYRIVCVTIARGSWAIRATFHDYYCEDHEESREWFDPLVRSFEFND